MQLPEHRLKPSTAALRRQTWARRVMNGILKQHRAYVEALKSIGLKVIELDPQPAYPDGHFVEDTAVVTPDVAIITNPGAISRQGEQVPIAEVLLPYREIEHIQAPGTVDGGDVLMIGNHFFIGISERTNPEGARQLGRILEKNDNTWTTIPVGAGLHFKSSVNEVAQNNLLVTRDFANHPGTQRLRQDNRKPGRSICGQHPPGKRSSDTSQRLSQYQRKTQPLGSGNYRTGCKRDAKDEWGVDVSVYPLLKIIDLETENDFSQKRGVNDDQYWHPGLT